MSKGADYERMVENVQRLLHGELTGVPTGELPEIVTITRRARVPDIDNPKSLREIDIALRYRLGGSYLLVIVECRNKRRPQTVDWVEQVYGKMRSVSAHAAIMVSRSGFTPAAIRKAHNWGIDVIEYREVDREHLDSSYWDIQCVAEGQLDVSLEGLFCGPELFTWAPDCKLFQGDQEVTWEDLLILLKLHERRFQANRAEIIDIAELGLVVVQAEVRRALTGAEIAPTPAKILPFAVESIRRLTPDGSLPVLTVVTYDLLTEQLSLFHKKLGGPAGPIGIQRRPKSPVDRADDGKTIS